MENHSQRFSLWRWNQSLKQYDLKTNTSGGWEAKEHLRFLMVLVSSLNLSFATKHLDYLASPFSYFHTHSHVNNAKV